jgi:uncharacterized protein (DUF2336 family)
VEHSTFQNIPKDMAPVLARLNAACALYRDSRDPLARVDIMVLVSDLMTLELTGQEREMVADVLIILTKQAAVDLRRAIAERLSALDGVPVRLVMQMANDEIAVARPVLRDSPVLGDVQLIDIISNKGPGHWETIASRRGLSEVIINRLADTRDYGTATVLAENITITLPAHAISVLAEMAKGSETLAQPLLRRSEIPDTVASQLYRHVGATLKKFILRNYEVDTQDLLDTLDDVVLEFVDSAQEAESRSASGEAQTTEHRVLPTQAMIRAASEFRQKGLLTVQLMLSTLRRGQNPSFVAQMSTYCGLEPPVVSEVLHQKKARALAIVCRAAGVGRTDFLSFYLLTNTVRSLGQLANLQDMATAVGVYDRTSSELARQIMAQSLDRLLAEGVG